MALDILTAVYPVRVPVGGCCSSSDRRIIVIPVQGPPGISHGHSLNRCACMGGKGKYTYLRELGVRLANAGLLDGLFELVGGDFAILCVRERKAEDISTLRGLYFVMM